MKFELRADFLNFFNHPQYTPGVLNNVNPKQRTSATNYLTPGNAIFGQFDQAYESNPRTVTIGARLSF
jgi:hypothetical protein